MPILWVRPANFLRKFHSARSTSTGFSMIVQIVFTAVGETKKRTRKSKVRETVCRANPNFSKSGWRQGLEPAINKRGPHKLCRSINYTSGLDPCIFLYFSTTQVWFLYFFLDIDLAHP